MKNNNTQLIDFIICTPEQLEMIREWRNHQEINKWMYNKKSISQEEHLLFVNSLQTDKDKQYFLALYDGMEIGVIDFRGLMSDKVYFGLYAKPDIQLAGAGRILESMALEYAKKRDIKSLNLEVYTSNQKVINLHKKFGFIEIDMYLHTSGEEVITMSKVLQ